MGRELTGAPRAARWDSGQSLKNPPADTGSAVFKENEIRALKLGLIFPSIKTESVCDPSPEGFLIVVK